MFTLQRRSILALGALGALGISASTRRADSAELLSPRVAGEGLALPIQVSVAVDSEGTPTVNESWVNQQVGRASELFGPFGVLFGVVGTHSLPDEHRLLETRPDRDALADKMHPGVINVFVVKSLRDVDDPSRFRMGVHWRKLTDLSKRYVIVARSARASTLAHELGHYLGNPHTAVANNLMSYQRDGGTITLSDEQGIRSRRSAASAFARGELAPMSQFATEDSSD